MTITTPSRIYLLRHAKASWGQPGQRDFDRPLDDTGYDQAELIAEKAADRTYRPQRIVSSTALRCRQTAEAMRRATDENLDIDFIDELYNAPINIYRQLISSAGVGSLMVVGHNPTLEELLEELAGREQVRGAVPGGYPPGGLAVLDRPAQDGDPWRLVEFLTA